MVEAMRGVVALIFFLATVSGQDTYGRNYRLVFLDNYVDRPLDRPVDLHLCARNSNPSSASVAINLPDLSIPSCPPTISLTLDANTCRKVTLCYGIRHTYADGSLANKVVTISSNQDIVVQGFNVEKYSADSFLVLPNSLAGQSHYILSYTPQHIQTQFAIVAQELTRVRITIPDRAGETITVDYNGLRYHNGETVQFTLSPTTSFLTQSAGDLTGTLIQTNYPVAVFTGNVRTWNDYGSKSRDHLIEQVPSTVKWGSDFIYVPVPRVNPGDLIRIIGRLGSTSLNFINDAGVSTSVLSNRGDFLEVTLDTLTHIRASSPVLVAVIVKSQEGMAVGETDPADPSLYFLPPVSTYDNEFHMPLFLDADEVPYNKTAILVAIPENQVDQLRLDDSSLSSSPAFLTRPSAPEALAYRAGYISVNPSEAHRIHMINGANMMAVGYGASDRESFASALGMRFNLNCEETATTLLDNVDNDCDGQVDEEICGNGVDEDGDGLVDEDCSTGQGDATGTSFAIAFMTNIVESSAIDQIELYISALEDGTLVNVSSPAYFGVEAPQVVNLAASLNTVVQIQIDPVMRLGTDIDDLGRSVISDKGIWVSSNKRIVLYGINKKRFSTDGFLALPNSVTGSNYIAYCNHPISPADDRCQFAVVASRDGTVINIELPDGVTAAAVDGGTLVSGIVHQYTLNAYQALEIQSVDDITGTRVYTDGTTFSFFSGNVRARFPLSRGSRDHLVEQLPPIETWGTDFSVVSTPRTQDIGDVLKIIGSQADTQVMYTYTDGSNNDQTVTFTLANLGSFESIDVGRTTNIWIRSNKPVLVIQISKSATRRDTDPAAIVIPSESQWSNDYRFVTPLSGQIIEGVQQAFDNALLLAVRAADQAGLRFIAAGGDMIDLGSENWTPIPGSANVGLLYEVPAGQGFIYHMDPDVTFMAVIFGRADRETYGNAVGLRLSANTCQETSSTLSDEIDNDCDGQVDEEQCNQIDDDLDGRIDEDCGLPPSGYKYYVVFQENVVEYPRNYALEIYVGNPNEQDAKCRLNTPDVYKPVYDQSANVPAGGVVEFAVSAALRTLGTRLIWNAITIECNSAVTVMGVNKETFSNDAFRVLELNQLGTEYYTVSFAPASLQTQFAVVAVEPGITTVNMTFSDTVVWRNVSYDSLSHDLQQNQIFQAQSDGDLTGSQIISSQRVAVFSGNIRTKVMLSGSRDHLSAQMTPTNSWGQDFIIAPVFFRTVGDVLRVISSQPNTNINFRGVDYSLPDVSHLQIDLPSDNGDGTSGGRLTANKPVYVMQIMKSQDGPQNPERADPCFIPSLPVGQYLARITLLTPLYSEGFYHTGSDYNNTFTIILPTGLESGIRLNGLPLGGSAATVRGIRTIADSTYIAVDVQLNVGGLSSYTLTHSSPSARMGGYMVGIADRESYCV